MSEFTFPNKLARKQKLPVFSFGKKIYSFIYKHIRESVNNIYDRLPLISVLIITMNYMSINICIKSYNKSKNNDIVVSRKEKKKKLKKCGRVLSVHSTSGCYVTDIRKCRGINFRDVYSTCAETCGKSSVTSFGAGSSFALFRNIVVHARVNVHIIRSWPICYVYTSRRNIVAIKKTWFS